MVLNRSMLKNKKGFTLIELIIVIAIIAILAAVLIPTMTNATAKAKVSKTQTNVVEVAKGYMTAYTEWESGDGTNPAKPGNSYFTDRLGGATNCLFTGTPGVNKYVVTLSGDTLVSIKFCVKSGEVYTYTPIDGNWAGPAAS